jgi:hypothetical protein
LGRRNVGRVFYEELKENGIEGNYGYVPNRNGGFFGFWWCGKGDEKCQQYLQLEEGKLSFKIWVKEKQERNNMRTKWSQTLLYKSKLVYGHMDSLHPLLYLLCFFRKVG